MNNYFFVLYQSMLNFNNQISSDNKVTFLAKRVVHVYAVYYNKQFKEDFEKCSWYIWKINPTTHVIGSGLWNKFVIWNGAKRKKNGLRLVQKNIVALYTRSSPSDFAQILNIYNLEISYENPSSIDFC